MLCQRRSCHSWQNWPEKEKDDPMKLVVASLTGRADVPFDEGSDYVVGHKNVRITLDQEGRPAPSWSRVSPAVLREIDQYVEALRRVQK